MSNHKFFKWYTELIKTEEALISQTVAAKMMSTSKQAVNDKIKRGTLKDFTFENFKFVSLKEVKNYIIRSI